MSLDTDIYTLTAPEAFENFCVDDLLDLSNDAIFSSSATDANIHAPPLHISTPTTTDRSSNASFSHDFYIPDEDAAELEWLSNFIDESSSSFPHASFATTTMTGTSTGLIPAKPRTKRSKPNHTHIQHLIRYNNSNSSSSARPPPVTGMRKCTHCASEQTPQWRTGPLGPKTLCNACGVRYKSGRLVPEYRPAASPTFVLSRHSNSHRKVMELRRQKEEVVMEEEEEEDNNNNRMCHVLHRHGRDYKIW